MHPVAFSDPFLRTSQPARVVAVIPARYASTRLTGKPLADIAGAPMIEHVYRRAARARSVDAVVVATDDERIAKAVERFGGIVRMTSPLHRTGTDRIAEIARELSCEVVVNVQGDLPLVEPDMIAQVVEPLLTDPTARMSTVYRRVTTMAEYMSPHVVKVVVDRTGHALYFSRAAIPAGPTALVNAHSTTNVFKHIGMYGYRREFLLTFAALPQTPLEQAESLEQLRALEYGFRIRAVETDFASIEIDTPEDLARVRQLVTEHAGTAAMTSSTNTTQGEVA